MIPKIINNHLRANHTKIPLVEHPDFAVSTSKSQQQPVEAPNKWYGNPLEIP